MLSKLSKHSGDCVKAMLLSIIFIVLTESFALAFPNMCLNPIQIKNPNKGLNPAVGLNFLKDCESTYIYIPCGHCKECIGYKQLSFVQRVQMEALENHLFFCTVTYNNESLPYVPSSVVDPRTGEVREIPLDMPIKFADFRDLSLMFKRLRGDGLQFRFVAVSELGNLRGRPHFHFLLFIPKQSWHSYNDCLNLEHEFFSKILNQWKRNYGSRRSPVWKPCCTYVQQFVRGKLRSTYDLHYVNPVLSSGLEADVAFYVSKYMYKQSDKTTDLQRALRLNYSPEDYKFIWNLVKPRFVASNLFGLNGRTLRNDDGTFTLVPSEKVLSYIRDCVSFSRDNLDFPHFINPIDGKTFPLCRYYLNRLDCVSIDDWRFFHDKWLSKGIKREDNVFMYEYDPVSVRNTISAFEHKIEQLDFDFDDFDDLDF